MVSHSIVLFIWTDQRCSILMTFVNFKCIHYFWDAVDGLLLWLIAIYKTCHNKNSHQKIKTKTKGQMLSISLSLFNTYMWWESWGLPVACASMQLEFLMLTVIWCGSRKWQAVQVYNLSRNMYLVVDIENNLVFSCVPSVVFLFYFMII